jgi:hypothetical protein
MNNSSVHCVCMRACVRAWVRRFQWPRGLRRVRFSTARTLSGIVDSNPARGTDVCPRFSVLCCPVQVGDL